MNGFEGLKEITRFLSVIGVSGDPATKEVLTRFVTGIFKKAVIVAEAETLLERLRQDPVDIVIIDSVLPTLGGLDLLKDIRKDYGQIPAIFIVSSSDASIIIEAIDTGVTQFLLRPLQTDKLIAAFETALQRVVVERQNLMKKELEVIKQKERQRLIEEKVSFERQLSIIRNDLYYKKIEVVGQGGQKTEWLLNVRYVPKDVLSGDCYSVRRLNDDKILLFIIDAMGKGLSALFTAHRASTFANYLIDKEKMEGKFDFQSFLTDFRKIIQNDLHNDESLSASFVFLDLKEEIMDFALFSMPPLYIHETGNTVLKLDGCNMPIMKCTDEQKIERSELRHISKILVFSDGLLNPDYHEYLDKDFISSSFIQMFYNRFSERIGETQDDLTMFFLRKLEGDIMWERSFTINAKFEDVNRSIPKVESILTLAGYGFEFVMELVNAYAEIIMNAYEHGSLKIGSRLKNKLVKAGEYEEYLMREERDVHAAIAVTLSSRVDNKNEFIVIRVCDEGAGFDTIILRDTIRNPEFVDGRGLKLVRSLVDEIYYNSVGNEAILLKVV
ncbi:MAG TPA: response regulator [Dissulfurispiraceae bacterium]|nr:response regulator [Dissulfurispiraceae bacterium]